MLMEDYRDILNEAISWYTFSQITPAADAELEITNVGYYTLYQLGGHTERTRFDYMLFYVEEGHIQATFHGVPTIFPAGTLLLYKPGERQDYAYLHTINTKVFWIHFYGRAFDTMIRNLHLDKNTVYKVENLSVSICSTIKQIYLDFSMQTQSSKYSCISQLINLLSQISVVVNPHENTADYDFSALISQMNQSYGSLSIAQCAELYHMSPFHFARIFKSNMGISPHAYQMQIKLQYARRYLKNSSMTINEISDTLNFSSLAYFCAFFKKHTGLSPTEFRNI